MKSPAISFYRRRRAINVLPWILIVVAASGLFWQLNQYQKLSEARSRLQEKLQPPPVMPVQPVQSLSEADIARYQALRKIVNALNQPVFEIQDQLARLNNPNIALLSVEQQDLGFMVTVEAKDATALRDYWRKLNALPNLSARLKEKNVQQETGYAVVRAVFELEKK